MREIQSTQKYSHIKPSNDNQTKIHIDALNKSKSIEHAKPIERFSLFSDVTGTSKVTHEEHEKEKEEEKVKYEKQFTMTFEACAQRGENKPWYAKNTSSYDACEPVEKLKSKLMDVKRKEMNDPMALVPKSLKTKLQPPSSTNDSRSIGKNRSSNSLNEIGSVVKSIDRLRQERLAREGEERKRVLEALNKNKPTLHETSSTHYNSQFNPEFVKKVVLPRLK